MAELAAQGLARRDIADRLVVGRRTVDSHLQRIYRKLGVSSSQGLADALRDTSETWGERSRRAPHVARRLLMTPPTPRAMLLLQRPAGGHRPEFVRRAGQRFPDVQGRP